MAPALAGGLQRYERDKDAHGVRRRRALAPVATRQGPPHATRAILIDFLYFVVTNTHPPKHQSILKSVNVVYGRFYGKNMWL